MLYHTPLLKYSCNWTVTFALVCAQSLMSHHPCPDAASGGVEEM